jgi:adenosylmethionine-8-amino-7-oxononanoate aminotransferase
MSPSAFLHPYARVARERFVKIVRGEGACVFDDAGKRYVDAMASLWYVNVGHGRAEVIDAVARQMRALAAYHCFEPFTNEPAERLAAALAEIAPMERPRVFLTSSGSEAVDTAIKLVRLAHRLAGRPEKQLVVTRRYAYHGVTYGGLSAQGLPANQEGFGDLVPGFVNVPQHDVPALEALFAERGHEIAAVLTEPVQGAGGVHPPVPGYLDAVRRLCDRAGAYLVMDEVICGFGRLGAWFGAERFGVRPDLVTFAKGVSSGYVPLGGVLVGRALCELLEMDPQYVLRHGHTYSGHPAACAAGLACLELIRKEDLLDRALGVGKRLGEGLQGLARSGRIAAARGVGAIWAAELPDGRDAVQLRDALLARGVIVRAVGPTAVALCPPLVISDAEIDTCLEALSDCLA